MGAASSSRVPYLVYQRRLDGLVDDRLVPIPLSLGLLCGRAAGIRRGGASIPPGAMATTRMPCPAYSKASDGGECVNPTFGCGVRDAVDPAGCH
jgi:hypothetical protein